MVGYAVYADTEAPYGCWKVRSKPLEVVPWQTDSGYAMRREGDVLLLRPLWRNIRMLLRR